jgi:hypothetical protein
MVRSPKPWFGCLGIAIFFSVQNALATTYTVTNTQNSGPGSLRQAIASANAHVGMDSIYFRIPTSDGGYDVATRVWTITTLSVLEITDELFIDGYTQPGAKQNTRPIGEGLNTQLKIVLHFGPGDYGIRVQFFTGNCRIRGLVFNGGATSSALLIFENNSTFAGNTIEGNFFGTDAAGHESKPDGSPQSLAAFAIAGSKNTIGGPLPQQRNLFAGRSMTALHGASGAIIQGNLFGTNATGTARQPLVCALTLGAFNQVTGNVLVSDGPFTVECEALMAPYADADNIFEGNFVGTDVTGTRALGDSTAGFVLASNHNRIGGSHLSQRNVISGNRQGAIVISGERNTIQGNLIGTQANRVKPLPNGFGIHIESGFFRNAGMNMIGGTYPGEGNIIAYNNGIGVSVLNATNNSVLGNSIHSNTGLGIDLAPPNPLGSTPRYGVTVNDQGDSDVGANGLQNFPNVTSATFHNGLAVSGNFNSVPNKTYRIEFFANRQSDPTGFGEGRTFVGFTNVTTNSNGLAAFAENFVYPRNARVVSATATDGDGNTSEFSRGRLIPNAPGQLMNISGRAQVSSGEQVVICGFVVPGTEPKQVIIRGLGPSLIHAGLSGVLDDPALDLYNAAGLFRTNENWRTLQEAAIVATGLSPSDDREAAILATLNPGAYTVALRSQNSHTGLGLVEVFDLSPDMNADLANLSIRALVGTGDRVLIGGLVVGRSASNILLRALGPSLTQFGISQPLFDPTLALYNRNGMLAAMNDNWRDTQRVFIEATGLAPGRITESAILRMLPPGSYTAVVRGKNNTTGVALLEAYNLQ